MSEHAKTVEIHNLRQGLNKLAQAAEQLYARTGEKGYKMLALRARGVLHTPKRPESGPATIVTED